MDVRDCDNVLMRINWHSRQLGWERFEELLEKVEHEIEVFNGRPLRGRIQFPSRIRQRAMWRLGRARHQLLRIHDVHNSVKAQRFFDQLATKIFQWLSAALETEIIP